MFGDEGTETNHRNNKKNITNYYIKQQKSNSLSLRYNTLDINIIIKYYPAESNIQLLNEVLMDIYMMEEDMFSHCRLEDQLFAESVHRLEDEVRLKATDSNEEDAIPVTAQKADGADGLSEREKEVIVEVVKGYSNKEIAEKLNISLTTVISHRKNITEKLGIKSVSGLTIYAVMNGYIEADSI